MNKTIVILLLLVTSCTPFAEKIVLDYYDENEIIVEGVLRNDLFKPRISYILHGSKGAYEVGGIAGVLYIETERGKLEIALRQKYPNPLNLIGKKNVFHIKKTGNNYDYIITKIVDNGRIVWQESGG